MTDGTVSAEAVEEAKPAGPRHDALDDQLISRLVDRTQADGIKLTGEGGLLQQLTKRILEAALEGEITDHLGHEKHERTTSGNTRNGIRSKTVVTEVGPVRLDVPRDREGGFEPQIVKKRPRRLTGVDEMVLSLSVRSDRATRVRDVQRTVPTAWRWARCVTVIWRRASLAWGSQPQMS
jgi:hypothetical protein